MRPLFFIFFSIVSLFCVAADALLATADKFYDAQMYGKAEEIYTDLLNKGVYSEQSLYKLANIAERNKRPAEAVFYLRKLQKEYGGNGFEERIALALESGSYNVVNTANEYASYDIWERNAIKILILALCLLAAGGVLIKKLTFIKHSFIAGIFFIASSLLIQVMLCYTLFFSPQRCVLIKEAGFYDFPSYAADYKPASYAPGTVLVIKQKQDAWLKVALHEKEFWVPAFTVRAL